MATNTKPFEFKINASPHLKMAEITKKMFNRNFHADVQFNVEGKIIYAHSLELIKRSEVFEQQLEDAMGDTKLIPVNDCKYEHFYQFVRFIYTDECDFNVGNEFEILKLALKYKVVALENLALQHCLLINPCNYTEQILKMFDHCIRDQNNLPLNYSMDRAKRYFSALLTNENFEYLHPDVFEELVSFDSVERGVTELKIFTALADWITSYCKRRQIALSDLRQRFDHLIRKIRFPTMTNEEIRECSSKYPGNLSESDCRSIAYQTVYGGGGTEDKLWISKRREEYIDPYEYYEFGRDEQFESVISVSNATILCGLRIGSSYGESSIPIEISEIDDKTGDTQTISFDFCVNGNINDYCQIISFGESLTLQPNFKYKINIKYLQSDKVYHRNKLTDLIINDPGKTVTVVESSVNMFEMFFKPVKD